MTHDAGNMALWLAWLGADGAAVILGIEALTGTPLLADSIGTGSIVFVGALFLVAGIVGLAEKGGLLEDYT
jgi:hypothetical protein